ncbi:MAG: peptidoglycan-binding protein LysM [Geobacteraceae bacterium GWC2_55_20]|nr:MAG: peptidoglycan-binding protein LysM [Geobacteraceae bacterium GWC2_55_20]OGU26656.1 MAG: peptidoglycan-binding protein LysM [Geobacteraceae bacterium GWF2_54_21]HBA73257.1 peptidoglycan endopeptidase [Geobacter sp.]HCE68691.1 peptidoglycan endopeptidase [Geobacter sp.]
MAHIRIALVTGLMLLALPQLVLASKAHVVRKSESLHSIARKYHVSVDELKSVNNLTATHVDKGMRIIIPSHADAKLKKSRPESYKVAKGDTLPKIARKTGIKLAELRKLNNLKSNRVKPGQILALVSTPPKSEAPTRTASASNRLQLINKDLLNEQELTDTLAELTDIDSDRPVDLAKKLEANQALSNLKKSAYSFLGARYRFGGTSRNALDCSSFTQQVFREQSVKLPRTAREQFYVGNEVARGDLKKGDLVFFQTYARFPSHVGIYLGDRKMIHASSREHRVVISSMDTPYYLSRYLGARRMSNTASDSINFNDLLLGVDEENENDIIANDTLGVTLNVEN